MLTGRIRSTQTRTVQAEADTLLDLKRKLARDAPAGFELVKAPVKMDHGTLKCVATFAARGDVREIEAEDFPALRAKVPEGWQLLSVRS